MGSTRSFLGSCLVAMLAAGSLSVSLSGCAGGQVQPTRRYGVARIQVVHQADSEKVMADTAKVDGTLLELETGKVEYVRLWPGKHVLEVRTGEAVYGHEVRYQRTSPNVPNSIVPMPQGMSGFVDQPSYEDALYQVPATKVSCSRLFELDVKAGETVDAVIEVDGKGQCLRKDT